MLKKQMRKNFKELRDKLNTEDVLKKSEVILSTLTTYPLWQEAKHIMCYLSFGNEVHTKAIIERAWQENKQVIIPVCQPKTFEIIPSHLISFDDLEPRTMGILEPKEGRLRPVSPEIIQLVLVPGVAFDLSGHRIGFGAGYYDRFLPKLTPGTPKVALAYEIQLSPITLPADQYDMEMDYICTEKKLYKAL